MTLLNIWTTHYFLIIYICVICICVCEVGGRGGVIIILSINIIYFFCEPPPLLIVGDVVITQERGLNPLCYHHYKGTILVYFNYLILLLIYYTPLYLLSHKNYTLIFCHHIQNLTVLNLHVLIN